MNLDHSISQAEFAALIGMSEASVSEWLRQGRLQRGATGRAWVQAYCNHLREQAAGRDPTGQLTSERARLAREQADRLAMENAERRGRLVPVERIEPRLRAVFVAMREQLLSWSSELPPRLVGVDEREMRKRLEVEARAVLSRLARWRPAARDEEDDDDEGPPAAEVSDGRD